MSEIVKVSMPCMPFEGGNKRLTELIGQGVQGMVISNPEWEVNFRLLNETTDSVPADFYFSANSVVAFYRLGILCVEAANQCGAEESERLLSYIKHES